MLKKKKKVVVIGNGMSGFRFCEKLLEYDAHHQYSMIILGDELIPAYDRVSLSSLFSGKSDTDLILAESRWYDYYKIDLKLGTRAISIDRKNKTVTTKGGTKYSYDKLVIATGARPHVPNIGGTNLKGVHLYRTSDDAYAIRNESRSASNAVIIGGGLLGLEAAETCHKQGLKTTIVERESFLMACQLDQTAGSLLDEKIKKIGIHLRLSEHVQAIEGPEKTKQVLLGSGESISADLVIIATGIIPNDELARDAGLELGARGGIAINQTVQTSDADIYAIGECASFKNALFGLIAPGYAMAEVAAAHLGNISKTFEMMIPASKLKLLDLQVASIGKTHLTDKDADFTGCQSMAKGVYKKLILSKDRKKLLGAILVGEISEFERLRKAVEKTIELPENPIDLLAPIGQPLAIDLEMEDDDVICFCSYVTKGDICRAIDDKNLKTVRDVTGATYAAGLCGSCLETVKAVTEQYVKHGV